MAKLPPYEDIDESSRGVLSTLRCTWRVKVEPRRRSGLTMLSRVRHRHGLYLRDAEHSRGSRLSVGEGGNCTSFLENGVQTERTNLLSWAGTRHSGNEWD